MSHRIEKINELIHKELDTLLKRELSLDPGVFVTIVKVDTTRDLRYTRVFVSVFPPNRSEYVGKTLLRERKRVQVLLNKKLHMKPLPKIDFSLDATEIKADEVEKLLMQIKKERNGEGGEE